MPAHDPTRRHLEYIIVLPGVRVGHIVIQCQDAPDGAADVTVSYTFTALSEPGNAFVATFTAEHYQAMMSEWERAINHYLVHGHPIVHT